ncbi:type IV fimbrial biogenesis protein FimT [Ramlibacter henchirensis]|uniref:Type II secretion system protein H n=1 Tax=Ramlibacter henchirensis TaxID=204072 RepID=A0A4Z0BNM4_9BURK|nr:GspH/FimT family protein [Ramlibacter henchirensis]TFZ00372.1 type IV fimbrial biogenesis protein FimT [Ramlibacter henchirensis]
MTLVEQAATLAVAAVVLAIGVPSFRRATETRQLDHAAMTMLATLGLARSEAIKRGSPVVLCKSANGAACSDSGGWEQGWITFHDANNNALVEPGEEVIQKAQALGPHVRFTGNLQVARYISFSSLGAPRTIGGAFQAGTLTACQQRAGLTAVRQVTLSATGRARLGKASASECL